MKVGIYRTEERIKANNPYKPIPFMGLLKSGPRQKQKLCLKKWVDTHLIKCTKPNPNDLINNLALTSILD